METMLRALPLLLLAPWIARPCKAQMQLVELIAGLDQPVAVVDPDDGAGRLLVAEQGGLVRLWNGGELLATPFLDLTALVDTTANEQGLLGLAVHPDFASNGRFFVNYTYDPGGGLDRTRIAEYTISGDPDAADAASARTLLEIEQDFGNHNGGDLHFGPDGYLYIGMGDGGGGGDPLQRAQARGRLLGKMLRIDVDSSGDGDCGLEADYGIPPDNPFVGATGCDEIWSYGLRNPWRFSFDRFNGDLLIADVGQREREEINVQPASSSGGENWEWPCREGTLPFGGECKGPGPRTPPVLEYGHDLGCSITGGFRYRGADPTWWGKYVYGDFCSGRIWLAAPTAGTWTTTLWRDTSHNIVSFGEDARGELYLVSHAGSVLRFANPGLLFSDGFESGDASGWSRRRP